MPYRLNISVCWNRSTVGQTISHHGIFETSGGAGLRGINASSKG